MELTKEELSKLREEANPVYLTAQSCLTCLELGGHENAKKLNSILQFEAPSDKQLEAFPPETREFLKRIAIGTMSIPVTRYETTNNLFRESGYKCFVDLPCGYVPRGLDFPDIDYIGIDLPAVIDQLAPAVEHITGKGKMAYRYCAADATNYQSLKDALKDAQGPLFISTEGMLMYFTDNEVREVFSNIHRLLSEYGGIWVSRDFEYSLSHKTVAGAIAKDANVDPMLLVNTVMGGKAKADLGNNIVTRGSMEEIQQEVEGMGFSCRKVRMYDYLGEDRLLYGLPESTRNAVKEAYKSLHLWILSAETKREEQQTEKGNFHTDLVNDGGRLTVRLAGRLDSLTAPQLLGEYKATDAVDTVMIDMSALDYISSAGLRVLLIMYKEHKDCFELVGVNERVKEILEVTGFASLFNGK